MIAKVIRISITRLLINAIVITSDVDRRLRIRRREATPGYALVKAKTIEVKVR